MTWKATNVCSLSDFVGFAGGVTLYQGVGQLGLCMVGGTSREVGGGVCVMCITVDE